MTQNTDFLNNQSNTGTTVSLNIDAFQDSLLRRLREVENDPCLQNLYFRYFQDLELGDSHFRESMTLDRFGCGVENLATQAAQSKQAIEEERIAKGNPNCDANQIRLMRKYGSHSLGD